MASVMRAGSAMEKDGGTLDDGGDWAWRFQDGMGWRDVLGGMPVRESFDTHLLLLLKVCEILTILRWNLKLPDELYLSSTVISTTACLSGLRLSKEGAGAFHVPRLPPCSIMHVSPTRPPLRQVRPKGIQKYVFRLSLSPSGMRC